MKHVGALSCPSAADRMKALSQALKMKALTFTPDGKIPDGNESAFIIKRKKEPKPFYLFIHRKNSPFS